MRLKISRILHAGYVFECEGTQIAFDPIFENPFSRNCHAFPGVRFDHERIRDLRFAAVFLSHFHDDHCSLESLDFLDRDTPIYLYCSFEELFAMLGELGFVNVHKLHTDLAVGVGPFEVIPRAALDSDVDSMFQIRAAGLNVLNVVDSWITDTTLAELAQQAPWDMVLWPFQTMLESDVLSPSRAAPASRASPAEFMDQLRVLKPRYVVPSSCQFIQESWSWYRQRFFPISYRQFEQDLAAAVPAARLVRLNPSVSVTLDKESLVAASALAWVIPVGEQDVDYQYEARSKVPPTAEIARQFAPLSARQSSTVIDYCRSGMRQKYAAMEVPEDGYFAQPRIWQLAVYDHEGVATCWRYRLDGARMEPCAGDHERLAWTTEVPAAKLYAALELGESLTSMYMRINDTQFDADLEAEIDEAELVDDPLIRCLFTDVICGYQAAQLRQLKART